MRGAEPVNEERALIGAALLFGISLLVRILPAFVPFNFSATTQHRIKTHLPVAVFVNLMIYCIHQEITQATLSALIAIAVLFVAFKRLGLLWSIGVGTGVYLVLGRYL